MSLLDEQPPVAAGKAEQPEYRFKTAEAAKSVIDQAKQNLLFQLEADRMVWDAYDRVPPNDPELMRKQGEEWCTNVDWGETEAAINERVEQDNNLVTQPMPLVSFVAKMRKNKPPVLNAFQAAAQEHYNMFRLSSFWAAEMQTMILERTAVGLGILHHPIPYSWHFRSVPACNLIYPSRATMDLTDWPWMAVRTDIDLTTFIGLLDEDSKASEVGWDLSAVRQMLSKTQYLPSGTSESDWVNNPEVFVKALRNDSLNYATKNGQKVRVFHLYVREYDGRISESILADTIACPNFLFQRKYGEEYSCMSDFVSLFPLSVGTYMEKRRGLGHRLLPYTAMVNDTRNRAIDAAVLTSSLMLKDTETGTGARNVTQLELGGRVVFIPEDMAMDQRTLGNPSQGLVGVLGMVQELREVNNSAFGGTDHTARRPEATATEMKLRYGEATRSLGFETDRLYDQLTMFYRSNWKRVWYFLEKGDDAVPVKGAQEAKEMWEQVKAQNVTKEDLEGIRAVEANRLFGDGDPNQIFLAIQDLQGPISRMPLTAQRAMDQAAVAARTRRPWMVQALYGQSDMQLDREYSLQNWRIAQENGSFASSDIPIPIQDDDFHPLHVVSHTQYAEGVVNDFDQGVLAPPESLKRLIVARDHVALHMPLLARDRSQQSVYADAAKAWQGIENKMVQMQQNIQDAQAAEQRRALEELRNPAPTVEEQQKVLTAQLERDVMARKADQDMQLKFAQFRGDMELKKQRMAAQTQIEALQAARNVPARP